MKLLCPECGAPGLSILGAVEMGRRGACYEYTLQHALCPSCDAKFLCIYSETRPIKIDRDNVVRHLAVSIDPQVWAGIARGFDRPKSGKSKPDRIAFAERTIDAHLVGESGSPVRIAPTR